MPFMTGREFELRSSSKDALCVAGGATILRARILSVSWSSGKADALGAVNVWRNAREERFRVVLTEWL